MNELEITDIGDFLRERNRIIEANIIETLVAMANELKDDPERYDQWCALHMAAGYITGTAIK